jgi:hypothetical protein
MCLCVCDLHYLNSFTAVVGILLKFQASISKVTANNKTQNNINLSQWKPSVWSLTFRHDENIGHPYFSNDEVLHRKQPV